MDEAFEAQGEDEEQETAPDLSVLFDGSVALDVGFAQLGVKELQFKVGVELCVVADSDFEAGEEETEKGIGAILSFMDYLLPLTRRFMMTYELKSVMTPQTQLLSRIVVWSCDPKRHQKWRERCICWKVVTPGGPFGAYYTAVNTMIYLMFCVYEAHACVYVVSDPEKTLEEEDLCIQAGTTPPPSSLWPLASMAYGGLGARLDTASRAGCHLTTQALEHDGPLDATATPLTFDPDKCPHSIDVGFAIVTQEYSAETGLGEVLVLGADNPFEEIGVTNMTSFVDAFVASENAATGFAITYDLRSMRIPPMSGVIHLAQWGAAPERKAVWEVKNKATRVVVASGISYSAAKACLSAFFYVCPPIIRTYILTDPKEDLRNAFFFDPP